MTNNWKPSNKWLSARIAGLGTIATMALTTGSWDTEESVALVGLIVEAAISYLTPNVPPVIDGSDESGEFNTDGLVWVLAVVGVVLLVLLLIGEIGA